MRDLAPMPLLPSEPETPEGRRASLVAADIGRGVARLLHSHQMATISEVSLANGRRADLVAITVAGEIWIVEIKSSIDDFRADHKWHEYRAFCDRFFFAVAPAFPRAILPADTGLIVADRYGGEVMRGAPEQRLPGARRKALTLKLVHTAAMRLQGAMDADMRRR
jgi:hypothetical protein